MTKLKNAIVYFYFKLLYRYSFSSIKIESGVNCKQTNFEGNNKVYKNSLVNHSFIGRGTYLGWNCVFERCKIGRFCSIAPFSEIIYGQHAIGFISTHPAFYSPNKQAGFSFAKESLFEENKYANREEKFSVVIGNDVWIGYGAKILEGLTIGSGAIIAAGAVVTKNVEPYSIVAGVPAKHIRFRFNKEDINFLLKLKWWNKDINWLKKQYYKFNDVEKFMRDELW